MKKFFYFLSVLSGLLFTACQVDDVEDRNSATGNGVNGFSLSYNVNSVISAKTKAAVPIEDGEDVIHSLYVLFFDYTLNGTGEFIEVLDVMEDYKVSLGNSGVLDVKFPEGSKLNKSSNYKLLICANIEDYLDFTLEQVEDLQSYCENKTEAEVAALLLEIEGVQSGLSVEDEQTDNTHFLSADHIPMSARASKSSDQNSVNIELNRAVCRFDVYCQASGYELVSASIWNASKNTLLWNDTSSEISFEHTERYYGVSANENGDIIGSLYAFENIVENPLQGDRSTTCLIVGLLKDGSSSVEYFRVNVNATDMGQNLKRNNVYKTTVTQVKNQGDNCERDAYEQKDLLLSIDINGWTLDDSGNIHYDGENILAVPVKTINLSPEGETREYSIFTLGEEGLTLELSNVSLPNNITAELQKNLLIVKATASNTAVEGSIELSFGPKLKATIKVTQNAYVNDYIELNTYELPFFSQNAGDVSEQIAVKSSGDWTAELYNGTYFSFSSDSQQKTVVSGKSGETFNLFTIKKNETPEPRYSFVVVKLVDKPEVTRVLVLGQSGTGGLLVTPENKVVQFDALGEALNNNLFTVTAFEENSNTPSAWEVIHFNGDNKFEIITDPNDSDKFTINASFNTTAKKLEGVYRVRLVDDHTIYTDIQVIQAAHTLVVNPSSFDDISAAGGSTVPITITSSSLWKAELTVENGSAYFNEKIGLTSLSGKNGDSFVITFPALTTPNVIPTATITVYIEGTSLSYQFQVKQESLAGKDQLTFQSYSSGVGSIAANEVHIRYLYTVLNNTSVVGTKYSFIKTAVPNNSSNIYQTVNAAPTAANATKVANWWKETNDRILFVTATTVPSTTLKRLGLDGLGFVGKSAGIKKDVVRGFTKDENPLVNYILRTGPFSQGGNEISADDIKLTAYDGSNSVLTKWPSTFIPLIMNPSNQNECIMGIDPTLRIVFLGDGDIFKDYKTVKNFDGSNPKNEIFLKNFASWLTQAAMYGENFMKQFR